MRLPPAPVRVRVDPVRLAQVLSNLLSNAAKYTDAGGRIELEARRAGDTLVLRVRDNGIGLRPRRTRAQIFEMFSQVRSAMDRVGRRPGHRPGAQPRAGGAAWRPHRGAQRRARAGIGVHRARCPARWSDQPARRDGAQASPAAARRRSGSRKVLLADDNADALETMAALLEMRGPRGADRAPTATRRWPLAEQLRPDVAILDIGMPDLNGYEVGCADPREPTGAAACVLIALTGWGQERGPGARAREAGFDHHCTKPVDIERLLQLVQGA